MSAMMPKNTRKKRRGARREKPEFEQKLLDLARVTRVVKGGRRFRFRATVVAGNRKGKVGVGVAKGTDVSQAIQKAFADARKNMITVELAGNTISHEIMKKDGAAKILLNPAPVGRGIIAGGAVRTVVDLLGVKDIVSKSLGTSNKLNVARATIEALKDLEPPTQEMKDRIAAEVPEEKSAKAFKESMKVSAKEVSKPKAKSETVETPAQKKAEKSPAKKTESKTQVDTAPDDLTKIEGVGPKIAQALQAGGLATFAAVAASDEDAIATMIAEVRGNHHPKTWPEQASLAAEGKWDELKKWQDELDGGR